jgi:hypothetical protein
LTEHRHPLGEMSQKDRFLVEWVANAKVGAQIPAPWCYANHPLESIVRTLAGLRIIDPAPEGSDWAAIARSAGPKAREWLQRNPPDA